MAGLIHADGRPVDPAEIAAARAAGFAGNSNDRGPAPAGRPQAALSGAYRSAFPYDAASCYSAETEGWHPPATSPDHEINVHRDRMVGRVRDVVRNDGWAAGAVIRVLDNTIGGHYRLVATPDYRALARIGGPAFDAAWAAEFRHAVEAEWRGWADGPSFHCDTKAKMTLSQLLYLGLRHHLVDGESLGVIEMWPERVGYGGSRYATTLHMVDPDRLSNPYEMVDTRHCRGGVQLDDGGRPLGYHLRRGHPMDWYNAVESMIWDYIPREDEFGRPIAIHAHDSDRTDQHRGLSAFVPVLNRLKMLTRFDASTLQAAVISAVFCLSIESPFDPEGLKDALETGDARDLQSYYHYRNDYRRTHPIDVGDARIVSTYPGEQIKALEAKHPSQNYDPFMRAMLRHIGAQLGISAEQVTGDWSQTNYSAARGAMLEAYKTITRRRLHFNTGLPNRTYLAWLEEAMEIAHLPLPRGAPDFLEARAAYARARWIGAPRGWVDPVKEGQGAVLRMDACVSTLSDEAAEQGHDWEETLDQRAVERRRMAELGIPAPAWMQGVPADEDAKKPDAQ